MPVANYTFNFAGPDLTSDTSIAANGAQSGQLTENGITFTYSGNASLQNFSAAYAFSISGGTGTISLLETPSEEFMSNIKFSFGSSGAFSPSNEIKLIQTKTTGGSALATPITHTITNGQINANGTVVVATGIYNKIQFTSTGFMILDSITMNVNCFVADTKIATPEGAKPVQELVAGDAILTADGRTATVRWLGQQSVNTRLMHPAKVNPIRIQAGALGGGLPHRVLLVSPDHALEIDGTLYNAGALVNGRTITQERVTPGNDFTYYHVETDAHELLLAEGVKAETFIDYATRDAFENGDEVEARVIGEMTLPRISTARMVPAELRGRLDAIADELGRIAA